MIVHVGQPSPLQFGHSLRGTNSARSVGIGMSPRRCEMISSNSGATLSYSFPSSARIGPRWNSTSSIAIFGTSARSVRRSALTSGGVTSSNRTVIEVGADARTFTFTLHAPPAAAALRFRAIVRYRRHILNPANSQACPCEAPDRRLGSGSRGLRLVPAGGTDSHVNRLDPSFLRGIRDLLGRLHRRVRRRLVLRRLHDHPSARLRNRLRARGVRDCDDDVVVRCVDVRDPPLRHGTSPPGPGGGPPSAGPSPSGATRGSE